MRVAVFLLGLMLWQFIGIVGLAAVVMIYFWYESIKTKKAGENE